MVQIVHIVRNSRFEFVFNVIKVSSSVPSGRVIDQMVRARGIGQILRYDILSSHFAIRLSGEKGKSECDGCNFSGYLSFTSHALPRLAVGEIVRIFVKSLRPSQWKLKIR
ncbi:unnamed protein product [Rhizophagus irregularis]|nr:unnamed protein product [Rhizophagus irregularis]